MALNCVIQVARSDEQIARCFSVMRELRPHLVECDFLARVRSMQRGGFEMAFLEAGGEVQAIAGFRVLDKFATGRSLYVDDLVTKETVRSQGCGDLLFDWLIETARERGCVQLELDSGVQRFDAHRFYLRRRMRISSHHFALFLAS
jgi:GNAT superfamily N-acetyltransferase